MYIQCNDNNNFCVSFLSLQAKSAEDFPGHWPHGISKLGPGSVSVHCLGHVLLLHLEGGEIHRKGGSEVIQSCIWCLFLLCMFFVCMFNTTLCVYIGGLLHCNLPLCNADCAADQRAHPAWCWDRHPVLPLPWPGATCRPTGSIISHKQENIQLTVYHEGVITLKQFKHNTNMDFYELIWCSAPSGQEHTRCRHPMVLCWEV